MQVSVVCRMGNTPAVRITFPKYRNHTVAIYPDERRVHVIMYTCVNMSMKITQFIYNGGDIYYDYHEYQTAEDLGRIKYIALLLISGKQDIIDAIENLLPLPIHEPIIDHYRIDGDNIEYHMDKLIAVYGKLVAQNGGVDVGVLPYEWLNIEQKNSVVVPAESLRRVKYSDDKY